MSNNNIQQQQSKNNLTVSVYKAWREENTYGTYPPDDIILNPRRVPQRHR